MSKEKQLHRDFWLEEKRFRRARAEAQKYIRLAQAWQIVMEQAVAEQHRINREIKEAGNAEDNAVNIV